MTKRDDIVAAAVAELGPDTHEKRVKYWSSALGRPVTYQEVASLAWCGGFALYALHAAGVALDVLWHLGSGFLLQPPHPLRVTHSPLPGDLGYVDKPFQHHLICEAAEAKAAADRYCDARAQAQHLAREALGEAGAQ